MKFFHILLIVIAVAVIVIPVHTAEPEGKEKKQSNALKKLKVAKNNSKKGKPEKAKKNRQFTELESKIRAELSLMIGSSLELSSSAIKYALKGEQTKGDKTKWTLSSEYVVDPMDFKIVSLTNFDNNKICFVGGCKGLLGSCPSYKEENGQCCGPFNDVTSNNGFDWVNPGPERKYQILWKTLCKSKDIGEYVDFTAELDLNTWSDNDVAEQVRILNSNRNRVLNTIKANADQGLKACLNFINFDKAAQDAVKADAEIKVSIKKNIDDQKEPTECMNKETATQTTLTKTLTEQKAQQDTLEKQRNDLNNSLNLVNSKIETLKASLKNLQDSKNANQAALTKVKQLKDASRVAYDQLVKDFIINCPGDNCSTNVQKASTDCLEGKKEQCAGDLKLIVS